MTNPVFDEIMSTQKPEVSTEGYVWLTMLIHYATDGRAEIVRSFTKPAKDSAIKGLVKEKKKIEKIVTSTEVSDETLF